MAKILIVDDSEMFIALLSETLTQLNFEVEVAMSKREMVHNLLASIPDLILLDIRLSGEDGRKMCRDLKANSSYRDIPVILISGSLDLLETFAEYQADDFIEKPFNRDDLIGKINKILEQRITMCKENLPKSTYIDHLS